jgi:1-acyl-sn-glycerol-3-phosphate acyltransferase
VNRRRRWRLGGLVDGPPWRRRLVTIPAVATAWVVVTAALPLLVVVAAPFDVTSGSRWSRVRLTVFGWWYLTAQVVGVAVLFVSWLGTLGRPEARVDQAWAIQSRWAAGLHRGLRVIFGTRLDLDVDAADLGDGPYVLLMRHTSIVDTLLPSVVVAGPQAKRVRYVLKAELLWDPCLDIAGHRLPNVFVRRGAAGADIARVAELGSGLGPDDVVLIYPEGTRFDGRKRAGLIEQGGSTAVRASALAYTLPPRVGGPAALLRGGGDAVFLVHHGLEAVADLRTVVGGALVGARVKVAAWRVPADAIDLTDVDAWLYQQWRRVDAWVAGAVVAEGA